MASSLLPNPALPPPSVPPDLLFLFGSSESDSSPFNRSVAPLPDVVLPQVISQDPPSQPGSSVLPILREALLAPAVAKPPSWVSKVKSPYQPLSKVASPSMEADGIPSVQAPDSIVLKSSTMWKDHLVAFFHGTAPSTAKILADLNPIWGKEGKISVKHHSKNICLIYIPCPMTRQWVLEAGLWHSGNCSFTVALWTPNLKMSNMKLLYAPVWVLFKKVPQELWSIKGFSTIASAIGFPVHSEFSDIKPYSNGIIKLRVVVELGKKRPSVARITDKLGNSVLISVEFLKLPPKCATCGEFGHLRMRCPGATIIPPAHFSQSALSPQVPLAESSTDPLVPRTESPKSPPVLMERDPVVVGSPSGSEKLTRSVSMPSVPPAPASKEDNDISSSNGWTQVAYRSKPPATSLSPVSGSLKIPRSAPLSNSHFAAEEEIIQKAQSILRSRLTVLESKPPEEAPSGSKKHARRRLRQKIYLMTSSSSGNHLDSEDSNSESALAPASVGQAHRCSVQSGEA